MPLGVTIRLDFIGESQVQRTLVRRIRVVQDMRPAWERIANDFARVEKEWFASRGNNTWQPLSPRYAHWKAQRYPGMPIMRREDVLYRSLTVRPFGVEIINRDRMEIGTAVRYAQYHQRPSRPGRPPKRPVIQLDEATKRRWVEMIQRHLIEGDRLLRGTPPWTG